MNSLFCLLSFLEVFHSYNHDNDDDDDDGEQDKYANDNKQWPYRVLSICFKTALL